MIPRILIFQIKLYNSVINHPISLEKTFYEKLRKNISDLVALDADFLYSPSHNVLEVSKADYDCCQGSNSIQAYRGGSTTIPLSSAGKRYFICGTIGH